MTSELTRGATAIAVSKGDLAECRRWIAHHSKSFYLSSLLLPGRVRRASWALYAFCRRADDAVDEADAVAHGRARIDGLARRLDAVYRDAALDDPIDRAYASVARSASIPRALADELLAGMEMDLVDTRYTSWEDLYRYCFRVASTVGLMMTRVMMEGRAPSEIRADTWLRAADLGVAMQLTNIARDVGEDARRGRVYLPDELLFAVGSDRDRVLACTTEGRADAPLVEAVRRLLARADEHYRAADRGVPLLPRGARLAIRASRLIYAAIGRDLALHGHDSIARRAHTSLARKLALVARASLAVFSTPSAPEPGPADAILGPLVAASLA